MKCKATVVLSKMTINGSIYKEGDIFGNVDISEKEFKFLNDNPQITGLKYEKIKESNPLREEADKLGITYHVSISDKKLLEKSTNLKTKSNEKNRIIANNIRTDRFAN